MKTLLLVRHAKSSWDDPGQNDFDRPLNDRGKKDAPKMAKRLKERKIKIDAFISSPARRAKKTAEVFAKEYGEKKDDVIYHEELYHADADVFYNVIEKTKNKHDHIAIFGHNPGITDFANCLTEVNVDNMPTCSIFAVKLDADDWAEFRSGRKEFIFFDYPKSEEKV